MARRVVESNIKGMREFMEISKNREALLNVSFQDNASPLIKAMIDTFPNASKIALQSVGKRIKNTIQQGMTNKAPGGARYKELQQLPSKKISRLERNYRKNRQGRSSVSRTLRRDVSKKQPLGRLKQAVRYRLLGENQGIAVGWLSSSAQLLGTLHEFGGLIRMSERRHNLFWASGIPENKGYVKIPRRPTIAPVWRQEAPNVQEHFENALFRAWNKGAGLKDIDIPPGKGRR